MTKKAVVEVATTRLKDSWKPTCGTYLLREAIDYMNEPRIIIKK